MFAIRSVLVLDYGAFHVNVKALNIFHISVARGVFSGQLFGAGESERYYCRKKLTQT